MFLETLGAGNSLVTDEHDGFVTVADFYDLTDAQSIGQQVIDVTKYRRYSSGHDRVHCYVSDQTLFVPVNNKLYFLDVPKPAQLIEVGVFECIFAVFRQA